MEAQFTYRSLVATACYVAENVVSYEAGRTLYRRFWDHPLPPNECTVDFAGELLRQAGVPNTTTTVPPQNVQRMVVDSLMGLRAVMLSVRHPQLNGAIRWVCAYGLSPEGLITTVALEPGEPVMGPSELWPNVTGDLVFVNEPHPRGIIVEIVSISSLLDEEES